MTYEDHALLEAVDWIELMKKKPNVFEKATKGLQKNIAQMIPIKVHEVITTTLKQTVKAVMTGSKWTTHAPLTHMTLEEREIFANETIEFYKRSASVSGAGTGAGGIFLGLADFPILLTLKFKMLFELLSIYGFDTAAKEERLFVLYVFQCAFSSAESRRAIAPALEDWEGFTRGLDIDLEHADWRTWQQEYRDYIDLAKLFQLVPGIGIVVGAVANYKLVDALGEAMMNACRLRLLKKG